MSIPKKPEGVMFTDNQWQAIFEQIIIYWFLRLLGQARRGSWFSA